MSKLKNVLYFLVIFLLELYIGLYVKDAIIRPYLGDILVIPLIFSFINIFIKANNKILIKVVFFAIAIEVLQYFKIVDLLQIHNKILRIIIGSTYDIKDILCYIIGGMLTFFILDFYKKLNKNED